MFKRLLALGSIAAMFGAPSGEVAPLGAYTAVERRHWAFLPRKSVSPPAFSDAAAKAWIRTPIDAFVLAGLRKSELVRRLKPTGRHSSAASPTTCTACLLRRKK